MTDLTAQELYKILLKSYNMNYVGEYGMDAVVLDGEFNLEEVVKQVNEVIKRK